MAFSGTPRPSEHNDQQAAGGESRVQCKCGQGREDLIDAKEVAVRLRVSEDWVWDHSTRRAPYLPTIRLSEGVIRYRPSAIEEFVKERERLSTKRRKRR